MYSIGIDVGSTYTKYCIMENNNIIALYAEKTPVTQKDYFRYQVSDLKKKYKGCRIVSCGYGKENIDSIKNVNELTALAKGANFLNPDSNVIMDIGGQDIKYIRHEKGQLRTFFLNDKCAAGSGIFLSNICNMLDYPFGEINLANIKNNEIKISSTCAVFAQSEIVEMISNNISRDQIIIAVIESILVNAKRLLVNIETDSIVLSGGLTQIKGIDVAIEHIFGKKCFVLNNGLYGSAVGCALIMDGE